MWHNELEIFHKYESIHLKPITDCMIHTQRCLKIYLHCWLLEFFLVPNRNFWAFETFVYYGEWQWSKSCYLGKISSNISRNRVLIGCRRYFRLKIFSALMCLRIGNIGAGNAIICIFHEQTLKFAILLCSRLNIGWLLPWRYTSVLSSAYMLSALILVSYYPFSQSMYWFRHSK